MTRLTVKLTQAHVVNPQVGLALAPTRVEIERQQHIATVVEPPPSRTVSVQGDGALAASVATAPDRNVVIKFNSVYNATLVSGDAVVTIFGGIVFADIRQTFETINRNLKSYPATFNYSVPGELDSITYDLGDGKSINKQFGFAQGVLATITLSGDVPAGVSLTKHLTYQSGRLVAITYS